MTPVQMNIITHKEFNNHVMHL